LSELAEFYRRHNKNIFALLFSGTRCIIISLVLCDLRTGASGLAAELATSYMDSTYVSGAVTF